MSQMIRNLLSRGNGLNYFIFRSVYLGPDSTPDYTREVEFDEKLWAGKKMKDLYERVKDIQEGKEFLTQKDKIVDASSKITFDLDHSIFTNNPEKYRVEYKNDHAFREDLLGNSSKNEKDRSLTDVLDPDFIKPKVQDLLSDINEVLPERVFAPKFGKNEEMPQIRLLTDAQLKKEFDDKISEAKKILKMPPVMIERTEINEMISNDEILNGYEDFNVVFTDISEDLLEHERFVVVREPNGVLRKARWSERDRMMQTFYPKENRSNVKPFWSDDLSIALSNHFHLNILEQIFCQFEPDSSEYIKLTQQVYEDLDKNQLYDLLRSSRFYGCMAFYFAKHTSIDGLLQFMINYNLLPNAISLVKLFAVINTESKTAEILDKEDLFDSDDFLKILQIYIDNDCTNVQKLKSTISTYQLNVGVN